MALCMLVSNVASAQRNGQLGSNIIGEITNQIRQRGGISDGTIQQSGRQDFDRGFNQSCGPLNQYGRGNQYGNYRGNNTNYGRANSRNQYSPLASLIIQQIPEASRILAPGVVGNQGAFYQHNDRYYYYPNNGGSFNGVQQVGGTYSQGSQNVDFGSPQSTTPVQLQFGGFVYAEQLAQTLPVVVNDLCLDMHYNYRGAHNFDSTYRTAYGLLTETKSLRQAQQENNRDAVKHHLVNVDQLLHQVNEQTRGWVRNQQRQIGEMGLITKLEISGNIIHHMMYDVGLTIDGHPQTGARDEINESTEAAPAPAGN